jgi:hypothetical protein
MIHCNDPRHDEIEAWYRQALEACGAAPQSERPANYDTDVIEAALDDRDRAVPQSEREGLDSNYSQMRTVQEIAIEHRLCGPKYDGCYAHWPSPHCRADGMSWPCDVDAIRAALASPAHPDEE